MTCCICAGVQTRLGGFRGFVCHVPWFVLVVFSTGDCSDWGSYRINSSRHRHSTLLQPEVDEIFNTLNLCLKKRLPYVACVVAKTEHATYIERWRRWNNRQALLLFGLMLMRMSPAHFHAMKYNGPTNGSKAVKSDAHTEYDNEIVAVNTNSIRFRHSLWSCKVTTTSSIGSGVMRPCSHSILRQNCETMLNMRMKDLDLTNNLWLGYKSHGCAMKIYNMEGTKRDVLCVIWSQSYSEWTTMLAKRENTHDWTLLRWESQ